MCSNCTPYLAPSHLKRHTTPAPTSDYQLQPCPPNLLFSVRFYFSGPSLYFVPCGRLYFTGSVLYLTHGSPCHAFSPVSANNFHHQAMPLGLARSSHFKKTAIPQLPTFPIRCVQPHLQLTVVTVSHLFRSSTSVLLRLVHSFPYLPPIPQVHPPTSYNHHHHHDEHHCCRLFSLRRHPPTPLNTFGPTGASLGHTVVRTHLLCPSNATTLGDPSAPLTKKEEEKKNNKKIKPNAQRSSFYHANCFIFYFTDPRASRKRQTRRRRLATRPRLCALRSTIHFPQTVL